MKGGKNRQPLGYTIIEVMIVLAVSGVMFLIAAQFINGKQERTSFTAGVSEMASQIQDTIQQVTAGQYSDIPLTCIPGSPPALKEQVTSAQGIDTRCVFIGKFFHFMPSTGLSSYELFTLAGNRLVPGSSDPAASLAQVFPVPVQDPGTGFDLTTQAAIPENLQVKNTGGSIGVTVNGSATSGFGFIQDPGAVVVGGAEDGTYVSGAQTVDLVYSATLTPNQTETQAINILRTTPITIGSSASICLTDGTEYALIRVGDTDSSSKTGQLSVNVQLLDVQGNASCGP
jgi:prepilin-type N-terminal cleavage/methylation domain-containing protein